ncbi:MAG: bifunctional 3'-5' exonuclease/DNA polymerase [Clostridia bacterium]|nr:bifunctional 3'-5' exonuclease/DNA polymerase [Clostridia bacterium]
MKYQNYKLVLDKQKIKSYIKNHRFLALDIETSPFNKYRNNEKASLDAHKSSITGISFSVKEGTGIYVPFNHKVGRNADFAEIFVWIKINILMNENLTVIIHNAAFETMFFYALGLIPKCRVYDTFAAAQMTLKTNSEFRKFSDCGLKKLVPELLKENLPKFEDITNGKFFDELSSEDFQTVSYACADSDYTLRLYRLFNDWFDKNLPKHRFIIENIESPTAIYVGIMKYNGIPLDAELMKLKGAEAQKQINQLKEDIKLTIGNIEIGENAGTKAFKNYLYKTLKLPVLKKTEKLSEAVDDETMILLSQWCKVNRPELVIIFNMIQEYRKWNKLKSTYIDGYLKFLNVVTNRIHPDLMPLSTQTGRFVSRNANLQNCPRKDNDPIGVRNFIRADDGKVLLSLDFSQIELRVGAFYCRDEKMLEAYRNDGDIHAQTTSVIFNIPFSQAVDKNAPHYKERRTIAKNCNFGVFYGLFPKGLKKTLEFKAGLNKSLEECIQIIKNLKTGYKNLENWQRRVKQEASEYGYCETYLGRRRYLPKINSADWRKKSFAQRCALNTPIQGTAADILKIAMCQILKGLPKRMWLKPILQVHDELVFEIPKDKLNEAVSFIKKCMEKKPFKDFDVPLIAEASVGKTFGTLKELGGSNTK